MIIGTIIGDNISFRFSMNNPADSRASAKIFLADLSPILLSSFSTKSIKLGNIFGAAGYSRTIVLY